MKKLFLILVLLISSCSDDGMEDFKTYDFTAYVETTVKDIKTDTGMVIHISKIEHILKEAYGLSWASLNTMKEKYPERTDITDKVYDGNLTVRTERKYYNKIIPR